MRTLSLLVFLVGSVSVAWAQQTELLSPHWRIIVDDFGYSDLALDARPGFEGREYLSGEWAGAISYIHDGTQEYPIWLNPEFIFPDWTSNSDFESESTTQWISTNPQGFKVYRSIITNSFVRITITSEMIDTTNGIPQGLSPASGPTISNVMSDRYVFRQAFSVQNISGQMLNSVKFFKFLHSLEASRAVYDNRSYGNTYNGHHYTISQQSPNASPTPGDIVHHDTVALHANIPPSGWEVGYYGIEPNDSHTLGKPSVGVHLSVESDALSGAENFAPNDLWVSGAMRFDLGNLAASASTNVEFLMSLQTMTVAQPPFRASASLTVASWGRNSHGQTNVPNGLTNVVALAAGENHSLALLSDQRIVAWGDGSLGQTNVPADLDLDYIWAIAAGGNHNLALDYFGEVTAWGDNSFGQTNVPPGIANDVEEIAAGSKHSLALLDDGTVVGWGDNSLGQLDVPFDLENAWSIAAGGNHSLAVTFDDEVVAWGDNSFGQTNVPEGLEFVDKVAAGKNHSLALRYNGKVVAWGDNTYGQTNVPAGLTDVTEIAAGDDFSLALKGDGTIIGWGNGSFGQTNIPPGLGRAMAIAAGGQHSLAQQLVALPVTLAMIRQGTNSVIVWPANLSSYTYLDAVLEGTHSINAASWSAIASQGLIEDGLYKVTVPLATTNRFFRLRILR